MPNANTRSTAGRTAAARKASPATSPATVTSIAPVSPAPLGFDLAALADAATVRKAPMPKVTKNGGGGSSAEVAALRALVRRSHDGRQGFDLPAVPALSKEEVARLVARIRRAAALEGLGVTVRHTTSDGMTVVSLIGGDKRER